MNHKSKKKLKITISSVSIALILLISSVASLEFKPNKNPRNNNDMPLINPIWNKIKTQQSSLTPMINNLRPTTEIFTNENLRGPFAKALQNYLPLTKSASLLSVVNIYNIHAKGDDRQSYANINATIYIDGIYNTATATAVYNSNSRKFTFWNLHLVTNSNSLNPAISGLTPAISGLTPAISNLTPAISGLTPAISGLTPAISNLTPAISGLTPAISGLTPAISNLTPAISGLTPVISGLTPAISNLTPAISGLTPAISNLTPAMNNLEPSTTIFTNERLHQPLTIALHNYLPTGATSALLSKVNVYNIHKLGQSNKTYSDINATINVDQIYGSVIATVVYNADSNNFTFWNLHLVTNSNSLNPAISGLTPAISNLTPAISNLTPAISGLTPAISNLTPAISGLTPAISNLTPAISGLTPAISNLTPAMNNLEPSTTIFTNERLHQPLTIALHNYLPTGATSALLSKVNVYNIHKLGQSNKTYSDINATINVDQIYGSVIATVVYNADSNNFTFWNLHLVANSNNLNPAISNLTPAISNLTPAISRLTPAISNLTPAISGLTPAISGLTPAISGLTPAISNLTPAISGLTPAISGLTPDRKPMVPSHNIFNNKILTTEIKTWLSYRIEINSSRFLNFKINSISKATIQNNYTQVQVKGTFGYRTRFFNKYIGYKYTAVILYNLTTHRYYYRW